MTTVPSISDIALAFSEPIGITANRPLRLIDPSSVWFIEAGAADLFFVEEEDGRPVSNLAHLMRLETGQLIFASQPVEDGRFVVIAKALPGTKMRRLPIGILTRECPTEILAFEIDRWVVNGVTALVSEFTLRPSKSDTIAPGETMNFEAGSNIAGRAGVTWVLAEGGAEFLGTENPQANGSGYAPLTSDAWLSVHEPVSLSGISSSMLHDRGELLPALAGFHHMLTRARILNRRLMLADMLNAEASREEHRRQVLDDATDRLFHVLNPVQASASDSSFNLVNALKLIGHHDGIVFRFAAESGKTDKPPNLADILRLSGVRTRQVLLSDSDSWWRSDCGALLGYFKDSNQPVALLPGRSGRYRLIDPETGSTIPLDRRRADLLSEDAVSFYRPYPTGRPVGWRDVLRHGRRNIGPDVLKVVIAGLLAGGTSMIPAILIGMTVNHVIPLGSPALLGQLVAGMAVAAVIGCLLHMLRSTALMRLEGRVATSMTAATWDRVLDMHASFYRRFTSGDLATRSSVFHTLRDVLSENVLESFLTMAFLLPAFLVVFLLDKSLGLVSIGLGLAFLAVTLAAARRQTALHELRQIALQKMSGEMLQFVSGISKLRSSGTESAAVAAWARRFHDQVDSTLRIGRLADHIFALSVALPALTTAALFAFLPAEGELAIGNFLLIYALLITLVSVIARLGQSFETIASAAPIARQIRPILDEQPASARERCDLPELSGEIAFDHVCFRYTQDGPYALADFSLRIRSGEFVAIVGESGSGKSTLIRIALGLELPSTGAVYFDGHDLATLNPRIVRRQIGVMMQDGDLRHGNILENIIGNSEELTVQDAWRAAKQASVDEDIAKMQMGMFTSVGNGSIAFSGGQTQRIRLAAALVRKPRILFLDEATSWLDAKSQSDVMNGIERLPATRVAVAHRLSTVRRADRICVLERGHITQQGTFDELSQTDGTFRQLMVRQMA